MSVYRKQTRMVQEQSDTDAEQTVPTDTADEPVTAEAELTESPAETNDEPVAVEAELTEAPAETADEPVPVEAELTESPAETADEPVAVEAELTGAPDETEDEPVAATRTFAGRLRALLPGRRSKAAATSPADDEASPVSVDADSETPLETEEDDGVPTFEAPKAEPATDDEPVAVEATLSETPTETESEPVAAEAVQPEPLIDVPDSPFPIEAALAAKARLQQAQATPNERPALRIVASSDMDGDVPAFLIEQIKRRKGVGGSLIDQQEPKREVSAA